MTVELWRGRWACACVSVRADRTRTSPHQAEVRLALQADKPTRGRAGRFGPPEFRSARGTGLELERVVSLRVLGNGAERWARSANSARASARASAGRANKAVCQETSKKEQVAERGRGDRG